MYIYEKILCTNMYNIYQNKIPNNVTNKCKKEGDIQFYISKVKVGLKY